MNETPDPSSGGRLVTTDGRALPLKGASLIADAKGGVIRVTLEQHFVNPFPEPLTVTYQMPLPADAAVSGFSFRIGDRKVVGEVDTLEKARTRFDEAVLSGQTAALVEQERSALFTQKVGNVPPQTEVVSELVLDQKLAFLPDGFWEWRFPTVVAPRYLSAAGRVADAARLTVDVADAELPVRLSLHLAVRDRLWEGTRPESPSHALHTEKGLQRFDVRFGADTGNSLDRDVVVRWKVAELTPRIALDCGRPIDGAAADSAYGLLTIVPPLPQARMDAVPRDLILLMDTSGSMEGAPISQAKRVAAALIDSLSEADQLEVIEFSTAPRRWRSAPQPANAANRQSAHAFVQALRASGGTEMRSGILEAVRPLRRDAQRQVVLMTDGLIGFESEIIEALVNALPPLSRVHTVGIGSAVNRSLTSPAARVGRGTEVIIGIGEDPERAAARILARTGQPILTNVEISGSAIEGVAPSRSLDVFAGSASLTSLKLKPFGGDIVVRAHSARGEFVQRLEVKPVERGEGSPSVAKLYARERVEDLEVERAARGDAKAIDRRVTTVGLDFQISTRLTSWIAVSPEPTVNPRAPRRQTVMPQQLPYGMSAEGLGLRPARGVGTRAGSLMAPPAAMGAPLSPSPAKSEATGSFRMTDMETPDLSRRLDDSFEEEGGEPSAAEESEIPADEDALREDDGRTTSRGPSGSPRAPARGQRQELSKQRRAEAPPAPAAPRRVGRSTGGGGRSTEAGGQLRIKARLVFMKGGRLAVELTVPSGGLPWAPGSVVIKTRVGTAVGASVVKELTTADGDWEEGMTVSLVLEVPAMSSEPAEIFVSSDSHFLVLELT